MCCHSSESTKLRKCIRALHCPARWKIIRIIGEDKKSTSEIVQGLRKAGERFSTHGLYYHLSELREAGIVEVVEYQEVGRGAPEKVWKVKTRKIVIDLLKGEVQKR